MPAAAAATEFGTVDGVHRDAGGRQQLVGDRIAVVGEDFPGRKATMLFLIRPIAAARRYSGRLRYRPPGAGPGPAPGITSSSGAAFGGHMQAVAGAGPQCEWADVVDDLPIYGHHIPVGEGEDGCPGAWRRVGAAYQRR